MDRKLILWSIGVTILLMLVIIVYISRFNQPGNYQSLAYDRSQLRGEVQEVKSQLTNSGYPVIVVEAGKAVRWIITVDAEDLNTCNETFEIPALGQRITLLPGENVIEFVPSSTGTLDYQCWMGMIRSQIVVVNDLGSFKGLKKNNRSNGSCH
jgi:uncharacterized protein